MCIRTARRAQNRRPPNLCVDYPVRGRRVEPTKVGRQWGSQGPWANEANYVSRPNDRHRQEAALSKMHGPPPGEPTLARPICSQRARPAAETGNGQLE